jgi:putative oxidoreductase
MVTAARLVSIHTQATAALDRYVGPLFDLAVRLWIARVFFQSGRTKLADWAITVSLFQDEYNVPLLPPAVAAVFGTTFELAMPVFLVLGLASRLAALPLIAMTCVIQFVLGSANPDYDSAEHFYWLFLLGMIVIKGPGAISLDRLIRARFAKP